MKKRNFLAVLASLALMTSMFSVSASAVGKNYTKGLTSATVTDDNGKSEPVSKNTTAFDKYLVMDTNANVPNATFNFAIAKYDADKAEKEIIANDNATSLAVMNGVDGAVFTESNADNENAVFTPADSTTTETAAKTPETANTAVVFRTADDTDEKFAAKNLVLDFSSVEFDEPGIYRYIITETGDNQGIDNDVVAERTLDVYVEDYADFYNKQPDDKKANYTAPNGKELFIANYVLYSGKNDNAPAKDGTNTVTKSTSYTNTYTTHDLTFSKTVTGNQGSKDKYFKFDVTISNAVAGTVYTVDLSNADETVISNSATKSDYKGKTNPATIAVPDGATTVTATFYIQHGQEIKILGLADKTSYEVKETPEDYVASAEVTGDKETVVKDDEGKETVVAIAINADNAVKDSSLGNDTTVAFTNDRSGTIPTGVILSVAAPIVIGLAVLGGIVFLVIRNKKREAEDEED